MILEITLAETHEEDTEFNAYTAARKDRNRFLKGDTLIAKAMDLITHLHTQHAQHEPGDEWKSEHFAQRQFEELL